MKKLLSFLVVLAIVCAGTALADGKKRMEKLDPGFRAYLAESFTQMDAEMVSEPTPDQQVEMDAALALRLDEVFGERVLKQIPERKTPQETIINRKSGEDEIRYIQQLLFIMNLLDEVSGSYDSYTLFGVAQFQEGMNLMMGESLEITGEVNARTLELMERMAAQTREDGSTVVNFTDAALEKIIRRELEMESGDITISDLKTLKTLVLFEEKVQDLGVLQYMTNLEGLFIYQSDVSDISVLRHMPKLKYLELGDTRVTDISALAGLTQLQELQIYQCDVADIRPLEGLTRLEILNISMTHVSDITPLQNLTALRELKMYETDVSDIRPLRNMHDLQFLWINGTRVTDFSPLQNLEKLEEVFAMDIPGLDYMKAISYTRALVNR